MVVMDGIEGDGGLEMRMSRLWLGFVVFVVFGKMRERVLIMLVLMNGKVNGIEELLKVMVLGDGVDSGFGSGFGLGG